MRAVKLFASIMKKRIQQGDFTVIVVLGRPNAGKTWTSVALADYCERVINRSRFKPEQFILCFEDYRRLIQSFYGGMTPTLTEIETKKVPTGKFIIWDEAARSFHAKRSMSKEALDILNKIQTARVFRHVYFFLYQQKSDVPLDIWRNANYVLWIKKRGARREWFLFEPYVEARSKLRREGDVRQVKVVEWGAESFEFCKCPEPDRRLIEQIEQRVLAYKMRVNLGIDALAMSDEEKKKWRTFGFLMGFYDFNNGGVKINIDPDKIDWDKAEDYERKYWGNYQARFKKLYTSMSIFQVREFFKQLLS